MKRIEPGAWVLVRWNSGRKSWHHVDEVRPGELWLSRPDPTVAGVTAITTCRLDEFEKILRVADTPDELEMP
jgi:hypothetical protein